MNRRAPLLFVALFLVALLTQVSMLPIHLLAPFKPDLLLLIMVFLALRVSFQAGAPLSWLLGMVKDVYSGLYLGLNGFAFLVIFLVIKGVSDRLYAESGGLFVLTAGLASLACWAMDLMLLYMFTTTQGVFYSFAADLIPYLLINCFCASLVPLFPGFARRQDA